MMPFSDNIIFVDTEFSTLDPYEGEILSIGLIKPNGESLYLELEHAGSVSDWVEENILPLMRGPKISREEAKRKIRKFVGNDKPYMVSFVNQFDVIYFYKLFGVDDQPCYWMPVDFAAILFGAGLNPENLSGVANKLGVDTEIYQKHNALDDAKLLRDLYTAFFKQNS